MSALQDLHDPLIWVDLEMTGLDPATEVIVEIAVIITDGQLDTQIEGPELIINAPEEVLDAMHPVVVKMHEKSGLTTAVRESDVTARQAEQVVLDFLREHIPESGVAPLAGNSVHADRAFLKAYMPELEAHCHYRNVDVSTVKELAARWFPEAKEAAPKKGGDHRALADIQESIDELRYYRKAIFQDR
ncbi:oligoribonuclease [Euzebya tangerina]|uniref:oligoribonuclease n=1 Tax=Euzebya tangerina TaxID=591198 RepID=UPI000E31403E|nr:oligoribonuclease [Euzebya tangerina]